ncbi:HAD family hydrolase [Jannaschia aquimarina]|uniref:PpaX_2 protein n=1 Tax=Jannaschia aquimarina TaxID=935700 RepID=A0A0D1EBV7_9RHOB|nr:HAD-IA family hydrolase [Jannaschia aquimarina]KIT14341.1 Pyrophosphatase PpaX [Jannaschia aquimarina]SNS86522.1 phosphoglycolate phosphatase [Jannaschia aquimarina]
MTRLAIFDVDGTLLDSLGVIHDCLRVACQGADTVPPSRKDVGRRVGLSFPQMVADLFPDQPRRKTDEIIARYRICFVGKAGEATLYPGVADGLMRLRRTGFQLGLATGKSQRSVERMIAMNGWEKMFSTLQCADHHPSKPHPAMIQTALRQTGFAADEAIMIGDTTYDVATARAADVDCIGVTWGYHDAHSLKEAGAVALFDDFASLTQHLESLA